MSVLLDRPHRMRRGAPPSRARLLAAVAALFTFDGAVFGSWAARIPDVTTQVGASHTALGLALLCVSIGALASMQLAGALCARLGAGLVATVRKTRGDDIDAACGQLVGRVRDRTTVRLGSKLISVAVQT